MKNSCVAWIGEIPTNWSVCPAGKLFYEVKEKNDHLQYSNPLQFKFGEIIEKQSNSDTESNMEDVLLSYTCVSPDTIMINGLNLNYDFVTQRIAIVKKTGIITSAYLAVFPNKRIVHPYYACYLLKGYDGLQIFHSMGSGVRKTFQWKDFKTLPFVLPSIKEQVRIANSLDEKCAQIDALIANQEKQIEKLKQYKQALITEVVTKGLDPTVPMKDSGVEWIGKINASYFVQPLKYLLQEPMMYGASESGTKTNDYYRYIRITDIDNDGNLKHTEDDQYLDQIKGAPYKLQDGDLLFARSGGTVGKTFLYRSDYGRSAFAGYLIKGSCNKAKLLPEYLYYYTQSSLYALWKESIFVQSTIQNIGANRYSMLPVITPSISEQYTIVSFIKAQCHYIDLLIDKKLQKNEKLNQYKKSLIYEYVTGKKEVV